MCARTPKEAANSFNAEASATHVIRESKPTVAAINGYAVGVGLTMILPFDVRIASTRAQMSIRFIKMGLMPELGSTRLLAQLVGLETPRHVPHGTHGGCGGGTRNGTVAQVTEPEEPFDTALTKATEIADKPDGRRHDDRELLRKKPASTQTSKP
ncbi:MAG: enoyl-CoA hydratase/isomerase family protein [Dehalococcoidia bacterium]|nr:enoyl-CoA hydratase/isomerase family protein [Dehalococcoidia bacterium]